MRQGVNTFLYHERALGGGPFNVIVVIVVIVLHVYGHIALFLITQPISHFDRCAREVLNFSTLHVELRVVELGELVVRGRTLVDRVSVDNFLIIS